MEHRRQSEGAHQGRLCHDHDDNLLLGDLRRTSRGILRAAEGSGSVDVAERKVRVCVWTGDFLSVLPDVPITQLSNSGPLG